MCSSHRIYPSLWIQSQASSWRRWWKFWCWAQPESYRGTCESHHWKEQNCRDFSSCHLVWGRVGLRGQISLAKTPGASATSLSSCAHCKSKVRVYRLLAHWILPPSCLLVPWMMKNFQVEEYTSRPPSQLDWGSRISSMSHCWWLCQAPQVLVSPSEKDPSRTLN